MSNEFKKVKSEELISFATNVFQFYGLNYSNSRLWAEVLVWANLRGVDSHGVLRIPLYTEYLEKGIINSTPNLKLNPLSGAIARLDSDLAPGPVALKKGMEVALSKAEEFNIGWCAISNMTHAGAVGYFSLLASKRGFAGIVMTASQPMMAYPGTHENVVSTNPISISIPGHLHSPLLLDMSTSTVGMGKVLQARDSGEKIPNDWGLDKRGNPTTDPNKLNVLSPLGGAKGAGLSLMIECLTSLAVNNPIIEPVLRTGTPLSGRPINGVAIALDISMFGEKDLVKKQVDDLVNQLHLVGKSEGVKNIYAPGERGDAVKTHRQKYGIPLAMGTIQRLKVVANNCDLTLPID
ncbi:MAG: Ldh family oxidoreductase [Rhodospirillaceae bacterium]|nr:Ldh family oxidoreductase [Rhodospirillaceae bacterium]